ncbi:cellulase family glycosylhydrolase [Kosmotoga pacifica]|uniref:cellulase family glycosylhydrolase n=1 Tax=Kosmotoga pacifica TaxID=1330330 RepID=UPI00069A0362|nr:cellulase family glycosylhydrolase [Kosmotoga pacifica]
MDYVLGVNYWSRSGSIFMWEDEYWNPKIVEEEIIQMKELKMNVCRFFILSPSFMPKPNSLSNRHMERLEAFLSLCEKHDLKTIPTFIVGHMSGENWDFSFREGRDLYTDPFMLEQQRFLISEIVKRIKDSPAIWGYLLTNEMPLYGGKSTPDSVISWAKKLIKAIKTIDPHRPVGTGDGCWNVFGGNNGFDLLELSKLVDFFGPHMYVPETDPYRHSVLTEFIINFLKWYGLPVIMEEFGASSSHAADENIALYYREVFFNTLLTGGKGNLGWCLNDFDYSYLRPYSHHPFELLFGIFDADGKPKPVALEFPKFSDFLEEIGDLDPLDNQAAILIPSHYNKEYPFAKTDHYEMVSQMLQSTVLAAKAGFGVDFIFEDDLSNLKKYKLLIIPCARRLLAETSEMLVRFAKDGGNVYLSYYSGSDFSHPGIWLHNFEELTGCRHTLKYGLPNTLPEKVSINFFNNTWELITHYSPTLWEKAFIPIRKVSDNAEIINLSEELKLIEYKIGKGMIVSLNFPLEHILAKTPMINLTDSSHLLYRYIASQAELELYYTDNPLVRLRPFKKGGQIMVMLYNVSWEEETVNSIKAPIELEIKERLKPKEFKVLRDLSF